MGLFDLFRRPPPIAGLRELDDFMDSQAAFLVQKCIFEYARARSGILSEKLFREPAFAAAMELGAGIECDVRLTADNRLIFGGGEKYSPRPPRDVGDFVRPHLEGIFPQLEGVELEHGWGGTIGVTMNRLPDFGRIGNSFYAHGFSGHGVLLTTLAGELMVEAMRGTAERFDLMANLPIRRFPGGKLLRHPLYVLAMLWYALRDRL